MDNVQTVSYDDYEGGKEQYDEDERYIAGDNYSNRIYWSYNWDIDVRALQGLLKNQSEAYDRRLRWMQKRLDAALSQNNGMTLNELKEKYMPDTWWNGRRG